MAQEPTPVGSTSGRDRLVVHRDRLRSLAAQRLRRCSVFGPVSILLFLLFFPHHSFLHEVGSVNQTTTISRLSGGARPPEGEPSLLVQLERRHAEREDGSI